MRRYLQERDELPDKSLVAAIPTSVRTADDTAYGNKVSSMFTELPVAVEDPVERVKIVAAAMSGAKSIHEIVGATTLQEWAELAGTGHVQPGHPHLHPPAAR